MILTVDANVGCAVHTYHKPSEPTYLELHHVIPQTWQDYKLWDPRTVALCRTAHGNVHWWLVKMMKKAEVIGNPTAIQTWRELLRGEHVYAREVEVAYQAMERYILSGRTLNTLWQNKKYGYI